MTDARKPPNVGIQVLGWGDRPHWGVYATLFLTSTALLMLEVTLTRFFSFTVWYHLAYLTISVALLGFGASGAIVAAFPNMFRRHGQTLLVYALVLGAVTTLAALMYLARVPLEVKSLTAVLREGNVPIKFSLVLLSYYVAVGAPFLLAGLAVGVPFAVYPRLMGRLYFWDLFGAAVGCILVVGLIELFSVPGLIILAASFMLLSAAALSLGAGRKGTAAFLAIGAAGIIIAAAPLGGGLHVNPTEGKGLGDFREAIQRKDAYTRWTALNRVDAFGWAHPTRMLYWLGAGIKKGYQGPRPRGARVVYDGSNGSNIYEFRGSFGDFAFLDHHILRTPYLIRNNHPNVLVIGVGGGIDMLNAIKQGARHVTGVELQPKTVDLLKHKLRGFTGDFYNRDDVTLLAGEGRHFIRKTDQIFDLIQITGVDTFAAQASGAYILAESYLYTVEAQKDYFKHLVDDGLLSMVVGDLRYRETIYRLAIPPLAARLALNGYRALAQVGVQKPSDNIIVVSAVASRGFSQSGNVLVKKTAFTTAEIAAVRHHAEANGFELLYAPGGDSPATSQLGVLLGPNEEARQRLIAKQRFRVDAVYDDDPFFYNVGKWKNFSPRKSQVYIMPGSFIGQLVLVLMFGQSVILGIALICFPLLLGAREGLKAKGVLSYLAYFLALGIGFMFIEISFVQSFVLFLGSPTHALSVTIFSLLLFSSLGSFLSARFVDRPEQTLRKLMVMIAAVVLLYAFGLARIFDAFLGLPLAARILIAITAQIPMGLTLGMFMPLGIACVARRHARLVPWAWGINGLGSVLGTTLAVILAMSWGFRAVALCAAALYLVGTMVLVSSQRVSATTRSLDA